MVSNKIATIAGCHRRSFAKHKLRVCVGNSLNVIYENFVGINMQNKIRFTSTRDLVYSDLLHCRCSNHLYGHAKNYYSHFASVLSVCTIRDRKGSAHRGHYLCRLGKCIL